MASYLLPLYLQGQAYTDVGATAYDAVDGAVYDVATGLNFLDTMVVGTFILHIHAKF